MAGSTSTFLKLGIIAVLLVVSCGTGYYYALYLPRRDAELENERLLEKAHAEAQARALQERSASEQQALEQRQALAKAAAQIRYQTCLNSAGAAHDASWAAECKRLAEKALQDHADCLGKLNLPQTYCDASYPMRDASPRCTLAAEFATVIDADLERARKRCRQESEAAQ